MPQRVLREHRLLALFALGWLLFGWPFLALFAKGGTVLGIPLVYAYLFGVWAAFIGLLARVVESWG